MRPLPLLILASTLLARAASAATPTIEWLTQDSSLIVTGTLLHVTTTSDNLGFPQTDLLTFQVQSTLRGLRFPTVTVQRPHEPDPCIALIRDDAIPCLLFLKPIEQQYTDRYFFSLAPDIDSAFRSSECMPYLPDYVAATGEQTLEFTDPSSGFLPLSDQLASAINFDGIRIAGSVRPVRAVKDELSRPWTSHIYIAPPEHELVAHPNLHPSPLAADFLHLVLARSVLDPHLEEKRPAAQLLVVPRRAQLRFPPTYHSDGFPVPPLFYPALEEAGSDYYPRILQPREFIQPNPYQEECPVRHGPSRN